MSGRCGVTLRHPRHPAGLVVGLPGLFNDLEQPPLGISPEDLRGGIAGAVVGDDEAIDALREMVLQVEGEDVVLVPHQQGHHQLHAPAGGAGWNMNIE